jgi:hypothetical protein
MSDQVAAYRGLVESLARKYVGRNGAELDDLVQEGLINVWQTLLRGVTPRADIIEYRLQSYAKWLGRQSPVPYEAMLPLDDYRQVAAGGAV